MQKSLTISRESISAFIFEGKKFDFKLFFVSYVICPKNGINLIVFYDFVKIYQVTEFAKERNAISFPSQTMQYREKS